MNEVDLLRTRVVFVGGKAPEALDLKLLDSCHREKSNDSLPFSRNLETSSRSIKSSMRKGKNFICSCFEINIRRPKNRLLFSDPLIMTKLKKLMRFT